MGCTVSKEGKQSKLQTKNEVAVERQVKNDVIDRLAHEGKATDVWSFLSDGADALAQHLLFEKLDSSREKARKMAIEEKHQQFIQGTLKIKDIQARFNDVDKYAAKIKVQDHSFKTAYSADTREPKWGDEYTFTVGGKGVHVLVELYYRNEFFIIPFAHGEWHLDGSVAHANVKLELREPFLLGHGVAGECSFTLDFEKKAVEPNAKKGDRGFIYASYLPVLDPNVPMPILAKPDKAFTKQDGTMTFLMQLIGGIWLYTPNGAENVRKAIPQPLVDRVDNGKGDDFWTNRRLNGDCAGFIKEHPRTDEEDWDYQIEWDWTSFLDATTDVKQGVNFPAYMCARFTLAEDKDKLIPHSIKYNVPGKKVVEQKNNGSKDWEKAKELYRSFEMNAQFTWTHVGVHFNVEQYAMAIYRNLEENHPIWDLLTPHFKNLITNNRLVVRPKTVEEKGVVTIANVYTYDGQIKMLQARFAGLSFKDSPKRVVPPTITENMFENCQETMWDLISQYVEEFFQEHPDLTVDDQIKAMAKDLVEHSPNKKPDAMTINDVNDLKQMCRYVIFNAIFYHAWVHWNNWDDFAPVLHYDRSDPAAPSEKEAVAAENMSNAIQTFVEFLSPTLKQWPILDPELGGPQRLKELLMQNATKINPNIQIATLIMSPNT